MTPRARLLGVSRASTELVALDDQARFPGAGDQLTHVDLESMTLAEITQAAWHSALRGEHNELFDEDEGSLPNEDVLQDAPGPEAAHAITRWEESPQDE